VELGRTGSNTFRCLLRHEHTISENIHSAMRAGFAGRVEPRIDRS